MDALQQVAQVASSGKSLKARNMVWLVAVGVFDVIVLLVIAFHHPIDDFVADKGMALRTGLSVFLPVPIIFLSYLLSHSQKAVLVFWRIHNPMPGSRAFSMHALTDARIDVDSLRKNVGAFPSDERDQNSMWYRLYKQVENDSSVLESHQKYLMFRDVAAMSLLLVPLVALGLFLFGNTTSAVGWSVVVFAAQYLVAVLAARNSGIRFVQNVLCIHAAKRIGSARRAASRKKSDEKS
ncbi:MULTISPECIES: hypothetical protein [Paraburkholderia]|uniref:hypothetical protein n=1 Tax=Paraburkholderia TaxID=1822464 RepID=UPI0022518482|nr:MULTISPECIES: hypothetical protein [Paraburkholderia]MCX4163580.1 hypothetical protein [Paraburkholderia megapolitana]MDN7159075.1 hypothetical protein [Paraburkholderia sp. CHISQ3]MDQ6496122.1 hypothetical protein [Paraburkholderia megapolitana]